MLKVNEYENQKEIMIVAFKGMLDAIKARAKSQVTCDVILQYIDPMWSFTLEDVQYLMNKLISTKYLRFRDYNKKRYFSASKTGQERWDAYFNASLYEITEVANNSVRRNAKEA